MDSRPQLFAKVSVGIASSVICHPRSVRTSPAKDLPCVFGWGKVELDRRRLLLDARHLAGDPVAAAGELLRPRQVQRQAVESGNLRPLEARRRTEQQRRNRIPRGAGGQPLLTAAGLDNGLEAIGDGKVRAGIIVLETARPRRLREEVLPLGQLLGGLCGRLSSGNGDFDNAARHGPHPRNPALRMLQ